MNRALPHFFTGMCYGLSAPLYQWLGSASIPSYKLYGAEDVRTAQLLLSLDSDNKPEEKLTRLNLDGRMKDLKYVGGSVDDLDPRTLLALHAFKNESVLEDVVDKLERVHRKSGISEWLHWYF